MNSGGMMRSFYVALSFVIIVALLPGLALSQGISFPQYLEFNSIGGGARAAGMGGAFLGLSSGEYGYSWNPAGMIFAEKRTIGLDLRSIKDKFKQGGTPLDSIGASGTNLTDIKRDRFNVDFAGAVVPFSFFDRQWSVGGGYRNVLEMKYKFSAAGQRGSENIYSEGTSVDALGIGFSGKINDNIGLGVTSNFYVRGSASDYTQGRYILRTYNDRPGIVDTLDQRITQDSHYSGVNFDIGAAAQFGMIKGGVVIRTPFDLTQKTLRSYYIMAHPTPQPTDSAIDRVTCTYNIPLSIAVGISVAPIDRLTINLDFENRPMSKVEIMENWESILRRDQTIEPQWQDLNQIRLGAEYILKAGFADIPLRAGFRNQPSVQKEINYTVSDSAITYSYGDKISANIISFGTGLNFQNVWFDLAYQTGSSKNNTVRNILGTTTTLVEKNDYSRLYISAGMYF